MRANKLIKILVWQGNSMRLGIPEIAELTGYSKREVARWRTRPDLSLRQYVDWAEALGYDVTLRRKKDY